MYTNNVVKYNVPKHVAIILDGNRRFSKRLMMKPWKGHEWGAKKVEKLFDWCKEFEIRELTLYALSVENFNRPKKEFEYLMQLFKTEFKKLEKDERIYNNKIRINFIGRLWMLPKDIQKTMTQIMEKTKTHKNHIINFALAYGGRAEVIDATKKIAEKIKSGEMDIAQINEKTFSENLYLSDEPELIIRTGESRLSGFLIYQSAYSEIIFLPNVLWPEFTKEDFTNCLAEYGKRQRRFGK
ncbi:di-trans,poly-cis-decaprenylcistransferase [Candidatus Woesearchaeota archaeon]|jgi:tritrans,polycis-undecaprenyl-diphosphate synthase [geranylgeranyl-diphosphate specific]|nr:di-trans,poly-cis-decaprenylcistransferase [Candidatus Woesearchaeota archaeon]MBT7403082.1 di-trans,poly-cis-decaprenylcistransferase [Candidatus Woesearchaeota archaeon]